ncbi:4381_t:CDS:2 [Gigaspora margarita]|uniref:4381_t:CDS:1 n=1 Tax=Gigaspora margarita TaxID=4874 RepID=A0ABN7UMC7_GIGMA|nr:4381_t:CDS:2 [Gigaspora margarita]
MSPFGNACDNRTAILYNISFSNSITGDYDEFTFEYVNGSEIISIWVNDTIMINTQAFEQMHFGLPKDINGTENIVIPDTIYGQIGLMPYQNNQIVGIALSTNVIQGGSITFGGVDSEYIIDPKFKFYVSNIHINGIPMNHSGNASFNIDIPSVQLDDAIANLITKLLPGGNYSNGSITSNCSISPTFDLSFEFENQTYQKWRLPLQSILKNTDGDICSIAINGNAISSDAWVFGSAFIENFYMVFDQEKSQFGIALRSDIDYDHTVYIQNKLVRGTIAQVAARYNDQGPWNWWTRPGAFAYGQSTAHDYFSLSISGVYVYYLVFGVDVSTEQDKWRGPFNNTQDYCWHYTGNEFNWEVWPC